MSATKEANYNIDMDIDLEDLVFMLNDLHMEVRMDDFKDEIGRIAALDTIEQSWDWKQQLLDTKEMHLRATASQVIEVDPNGISSAVFVKDKCGLNRWRIRAFGRVKRKIIEGDLCAGIEKTWYHGKKFYMSITMLQSQQVWAKVEQLMSDLNFVCLPKNEEQQQCEQISNYAKLSTNVFCFCNYNHTYLNADLQSLS
jgi:hypothetical protein